MGPCPRVTGGLAVTGLRGSEFYPVLALPLLSQEAEGGGRVTAQKDKEENLSKYTFRAQTEQVSGDAVGHCHPAPVGSMQTGLGKGVNYSVGKKKKQTKDGVVSHVRYVLT